DAQYELIQSLLPEVIGYLDLCRLYTSVRKVSGYPMGRNGLRANSAEHLLRPRSGALFENNASTLRFGQGSPQGSLHFFKANNHVGRLILSDDSHGPHAVGFNYGQVQEYLRHAADTELWFLKQSESPNSCGSNVRCVKMDQYWATYPCWMQFS
ncbi:hypothetical protein C8R43DRAFT_889136, partial [Mycena crocata]